MREIKFRAWDDGRKVMVREKLIHTESLMIVDERGFDLMQYTGLKDNNGVEIYEGDILGGSNFIWKVEWSSANGFVGVIKDNTTYPLAKVIKKRMVAGVPIEVIGNIYKNPDLLEKHNTEQG